MAHDYGKVFSQFEEEVETAIDDVYLQEGYVDDHGDPSELAMKEAAFRIAMKNFVVASKRERSKKALAPGQLYSLVFPSGPGAGEAASTLDPVSEQALKKLSSKLWGLTQTRRSGYFQRRLEADESTLVVCRCQVLRHAESTQAVYATDNEMLILEDAVDKEIQSLFRRASSLRRDLSMVLERHPKLHGKVVQQLGTELRHINHELTLGSGDEDPQKQPEASAKS